jgi:dTDP-4-amino-4,6-dideoxygalactose transaminase
MQKQNTERQLALLGGAPTFPQPLHVGRPNIGDRASILRRVNEILDRRWLSNDGPVAKEFEAQIAKFAKVKHCIAMCNATVALEIAIRALDFKGEVIVPSFTFVATAHALQWQAIRPVFADIDPVTHNIDPAAVEKLITKQTTGIIGVHLWGRPCNTEALEEIGQRHGLKVMYDAAHAFGCSHRGKMIGNFGACEVYSFHATKFLNSFEGGAIVTNDDELAAKLRFMRNFGFAGYDKVDYLGVNGKMTEICAAMGLTSLEAIDELVATNRRNHNAYAEQLRDLPGTCLVHYDAGANNNFQYVVLQVDGNVAPLNRDELLQVLHAENVLARRYFWPGCHRMEPYRTLQPDAAKHLPETESVAARVLILPTGQEVSAQTVGKVCDIIRTAFKNADKVRATLATARQQASGNSSQPTR